MVEVAAVLVGGGPLAALAAQAGKFGATTVYVAQDDSLDPPLPQPRVDVLAEVVRTGGYDTVLFSNSVLAADVAAALAARLDAGLNWDLVDITERRRRTRRQTTGAAGLGARRCRLALAASHRALPIRLLRSRDHGRRTRVVETVAVQLQRAFARRDDRQPEPSRRQRARRSKTPRSSSPGGIGLGSAESFALAEELAELLGGAVGATRAAVYKGWYPHTAQVGQTGKTVTPKLYVALGISGAVQHKVGMQNSKVIVAINKDASAPIFEFSDLSVVGDVHTIVPALIELLRQRKQ